MNESIIDYALSLRADPYPFPNYRVATPGTLTESLFFSPRSSPLACDTESLPDGSPYCVTICDEPGTGWLIYVDDKETMEVLHEGLAGSSLLLFHNYLHDVTPFEQLALPIPSFLDTMVLAYELCLGGGGDDDEGGMGGRGSLGLKQLSYRYLNMSMTSFQDTVYPHSIPKLHAYLREFLTLIPVPPKIKHTPSPTDLCQCSHPFHRGKCKVLSMPGEYGLSFCPCKSFKPIPTISQTLLKEEEKQIALLRRKITSLLSSKKPDLDPWKLIKDWHAHDHELLLINGPLPRPSIADVPEPELVQYACRDADATLRLYLFLSKMTTGDPSPWLFF